MNATAHHHATKQIILGLGHVDDAQPQVVATIDIEADDALASLRRLRAPFVRRKQANWLDYFVLVRKSNPRGEAGRIVWRTEIGWKRIHTQLMSGYRYYVRDDLCLLRRVLCDHHASTTTDPEDLIVALAGGKP